MSSAEEKQGWWRLAQPWLSVLVVAAYLLLTLPATPLGFPIDDSWIHQVFARNLAQHGQFAYNLGQPVAGSTSPLWTFLLAPGHWLPGDLFMAWAYLLGMLFLGLVARETYLLTRLLTRRETLSRLALLLTLFEWHLAWAAASGMETLVFAFGSLFLVRRWLTEFSIFDFRFSIGNESGVRGQGSGVSKNDLQVEEAKAGNAQSITTEKSKIENHLSPNGGKSKILIGFLAGLLTLVRPEGLMLLGLIGLDWAWGNWGQWRRLVSGWAGLGLGVLILGLPYAAFNYWLSGSPLPNTFGAKTGYYDTGSLSAFLDFAAGGLREIWLAGPLFLLLPGLLISLGLIIRRQLDGRALVWPPVLFLLYGLRLPVTYHHARYLMPLIPFLVVYGLIGTAYGLVWLRRHRFPQLARAVPLLIALAWGVAWYNGGQSYQSDVRVINDEQVAVGKWLAANTPPDTLVATHDIGAIKFFSNRPLVDIAGLISPEFVKIVRDERAILARLQALNVNYLAMLPNWYSDGYLYQTLSQTHPVAFRPDDPYLAQFGPENLMTVFRLK